MIQYEITNFFKKISFLFLMVIVTGGWYFLNPSLYKYFEFAYWTGILYVLYKTCSWSWTLLSSVAKRLME